MILSCGSRYFKNLFARNFSETTFSSESKQNRSVNIWIPNGNVVLLEILLNFLLIGLLVVPEHMSYQSWLELYELADYFSEKELCTIISYMIWSKI